MSIVADRKLSCFSPPPSAANGLGNGSRGHGRLPVKEHHRFGAMPRSRSCQHCGCQKEGGGDEQQKQTRQPSREDGRWWLEPTAEEEQRGRLGNGQGGEWQRTALRGSLTLHSFLANSQPRCAIMLSSSDGLSASCSGSPCSSMSLINGEHHQQQRAGTIDASSRTTLANGCGERPQVGLSSSPAKCSWPPPEELARCLARLFPSVEHSPSQEDVFAHLLCLRAFISPPDLLHKLLQHCLFIQHASADNFTRDSQRRLFGHMLAFCGEWVRAVPYDFRSQQMRDRLLAVLALSGAQKDSEAQVQCDELLVQLRTALVRMERYEQAIRSLEPQLERNWAVQKWDQLQGLAAMGQSPAVVAQQLAHIESERLSMVGLDQLVACLSSASSLDQLPTGSSSAAGGSSVHHCVQWFNQLSQLVASEVLRHQHKRHRARCAEFFVEVAKHCLAQGNFNSLMAIVAGLSAQPVARLRRTWARVEKSRLEMLQRQLDPSGNFTAYRATLKAAVWAGERSSPAPVIPFFGLLLKDLFHLFRQCLLPEPGGGQHLNQMAFTAFAGQLAQLDRWKRVPCTHPRVTQVLQHLLLSSLLPETAMFLLSYGHEPAENGAEREQLRRLNAAQLQDQLEKED